VGTWQHGDLEIHVSVAVAYGIWHYVKLTNDKQFLYNEGIEMLLQICRYYSSRGQWGQKTGDFGFFGVMGPDEFAMMVHNNYYTNAMVKKCFEFTLQVVDMMRKDNQQNLVVVEQKVKLKTGEYADWAKKAEKMRINLDPETGIYEQYDGYFNTPHVDVSKIPDSEFPLYKNWAYVRIFRNDMLKQPDVLLMHLFYSNDYTLENKRVNFEFYEKRCSHESSLSPAIHSILASELGMNEKAYSYARYASRLDLDNYNNNTHEGIHNTSMAAAWMNIVYGFAGLRTDGNLLTFNPTLPREWDRYAFKLNYMGRIIDIIISKENLQISLEKGSSLAILIYGEEQTISATPTVFNLKNNHDKERNI
jgi:maltose phosphorylase